MNFSLHAQRFITYINWLNEKAQSKKLDYGCIMLYADVPSWNNHISIIEKEDIYDDEFKDFGLEKTPHATILFGIHLDEVKPRDVQVFMKTSFSPIEVMINTISIFPAGEEKEYDVVKYDVPVTPELRQYHDLVAKTFPNTQTYPEYHPHMTIAYVKNGEGKKYEGKVKPFKVKFDMGVYSYKGTNDTKQKIKVKL